MKIKNLLLLAVLFSFISCNSDDDDMQEVIMDSISGTVSCFNGQGLADVTVTLTDNLGNSQTTLSDLNGDYSFDNPVAGMDYNISVHKNVSNLSIDSAHLLTVRDYILQVVQFNHPMQLLCMDNTDDGVITTLDLVYTMHLITGADNLNGTTMSDDGILIWRFASIASISGTALESEITIQNFSNSVDDADFMGIHMSDPEGTVCQ